MRKYKTRKLATITALLLAALGIMTFTQSAAFGQNTIPGLSQQSRRGRVGAVYVMTNGVSGNSVVHFRRAANGSLAMREQSQPAGAARETCWKIKVR